MKKGLFILFLSIMALCANSQTTANNGISYFLPKTQMKLAILVEKTTYTPGEYAQYAEIYLKKKADLEPKTSYKIVGLDMYLTAIPDSSKHYTLAIDRKHSIVDLKLDQNGVITAINGQAQSIAPFKQFNPSLKPKALDPRDFLSQDALNADSKWKTAELIAQDIYEVRESKDMLSKGEAEYMPKDGEQLKLMLNQLNLKEKGLRELFEGKVVCDTTQFFITFTPEKEKQRSVAFRFSKHFGLCAADDLSGEPCYAVVTDLNSIPAIETSALADKKQKDDTGLYVNQPGKIKVSFEGEPINNQSFEFYAAQFGRVEMLNSTLFGKKFITHITLNPINGAIEHLKTEPLD